MCCFSSSHWGRGAGGEFMMPWASTRDTVINVQGPCRTLWGFAFFETRSPRLVRSKDSDKIHLPKGWLCQMENQRTPNSVYYLVISVPSLAQIAPLCVLYLFSYKEEYGKKAVTEDQNSSMFFVALAIPIWCKELLWLYILSFSLTKWRVMLVLARGNCHSK